MYVKFCHMQHQWFSSWHPWISLAPVAGQAHLIQGSAQASRTGPASRKKKNMSRSWNNRWNHSWPRVGILAWSRVLWAKCGTSSNSKSFKSGDSNLTIDEVKGHSNFFFGPPSMKAIFKVYVASTLEGHARRPTTLRCMAPQPRKKTPKWSTMHGKHWKIICFRSEMFWSFHVIRKHLKM